MIPLHAMSDSNDRRNARPEPLNFSDHANGFNITSFTVQTPTALQPPTSLTRPPAPQRWTSPEFIVYGILFVLVFPYMVYSPMQLSNGKLYLAATTVQQT